MRFYAIWHIFLGLEWPQISFKMGPLQNKKQQRPRFRFTDKHAYIPILPKTPWISPTIKSKFNFKNIFPDIVYNVKYKIDFAKNRGARAPGPAPGYATGLSVFFWVYSQLVLSQLISKAKLTLT